MGRSQLKYRPTRGRGQGESARGGRGGGGQKEGGGRGGGGRGRRSGGRPLESNAFRYEERAEQDGEDVSTDVAGDHSTSRQFFAEERQYRDMGDTKESYFRTKAMQEWDADDDEGEEATGTVGIMDFAWIAEQLSSVPLSARFQIDPKFRVDVPDEETAEEDSDEELTPQPTASVERTADVTVQSKPGSAQGTELDELLALSSAAATTSSMQTALAASTLSAAATLESPATGSGEQENLEDWLDDVLDM